MKTTNNSSFIRSVIVFQSNRDGNFQIYKMNSDGTNQIRLTNHAGNDYWPSWGRDPVQTGIEDHCADKLQGIKLLQNYPNPCKSVTTIEFEVYKPGLVSLRIYNHGGQEVAVLINEHMHQGLYSFDWSCTGQSNGICYYQLTNGLESITKQMVIAN